MKIGIIGNGFVGKATALFKCNLVEVFIYDIVPENCNPIGTTLEDINNCELVFICVPTPLDYTGKCKTDIVENVINQLTNDNIVIRSTVPIGFASKSNCYFMPEFLTEKNWKNDFITNKNWVVGLKENHTENFVNNIRELIVNAFAEGSINHSNIVFCKNEEAEMAKLIKNTFLANKVSFFNEMYDLAQKLNVDYNQVIQLVSLDSRMGTSHFQVPGPPDVRGVVKRGAGGTCLPKDSTSMFSLLEGNEINSIIVESCLYRNEYFDRRERDWLNDHGRTLFRTDKSIVLVCGDRSYLTCKELLNERNNIVIYLEKELHEFKENKNFYYKKVPLTKKLFFPKIDSIFYIISNEVPTDYNTLKDISLSIINLVELAELHKCKFNFEGNFYSKALYDAYVNSLKE